MGDVINLDEYRKRRAKADDKPKGGAKRKKRGVARGAGKASDKKPKNPTPRKKPETKVD